jgi:hypothetical protein
MGLFWDLIQQNQIEGQRSRANSLEQRVELLEKTLLDTRRLLVTVMKRLESHLGEDVNRDGNIA